MVPKLGPPTWSLNLVPKLGPLTWSINFVVPQLGLSTLSLNFVSTWSLNFVPQLCPSTLSLNLVPQNLVPQNLVPQTWSFNLVPQLGPSTWSLNLVPQPIHLHTSGFLSASCSSVISVLLNKRKKKLKMFLNNKTKYFCSDSMMKYALIEGLERCKRELRES